MSIRLIATDLDGTFLGSSSEVPPENAAAFRAADQQGIAVCICSGRSPNDIRHFLTGMDCSAWMIGYNGAVIQAPDGRLIYEKAIDPDILKDALQWVESTGILYHMCVLEKRYIITKDSDLDRAEKSRRSLCSHGVPSEILSSWTEIPERDLYRCMKIIVSGKSREDGDFLRSESEKQDLPVTVTSSWFNNIEIVAKEVNKGAAMKRLYQSLGIRAEEVMAFGDQKNDLPMLMAVGWPVVMSNGDEETKAVAKVIAPPNTESGVAQILRTMVLL